jgi:hypothetical protein
MTTQVFADLTDEELLATAANKSTSTASNNNLSYEDNLLLEAASQDLANSLDTKTGAPLRIRAMVAAAQSPEDQLATIRQEYPDALPVEVFMEGGADQYGIGNFVYTNPETGQPTLFDEDGGGRLFGLTLADITADIGPELAETVGAIGGGIAGAIGGASAGTVALPVVGTVAGGTAGFVAGEGAGSAAAREAYIRALDWFGDTVDTRSFSESMGDMAVTGSINAMAGPVLSKIWRGAKYTGGRVRSIAKGAMSKTNEEAMKIFNRVGVPDPTVAQVTGSPMANFVERGLQIMPTSTRIMRESAEKTINDIENAQIALTNRYGGAGTFEETSEKVMKGAQRARATYDANVSRMYKEVGELIPDNFVSNGTNVTQFINMYLADAATNTGKESLNPALSQASKLAKDAADGVLTYDRLKRFRTSMMRGIRAAESKGALDDKEQKLNELIGYVTKDLYDLVDDAAKSIGPIEAKGGKTVLDLYKDANAFVAKNKDISGDITFIDNVIKRGKVESTGALKYALSGANDSGIRLRKLRSQFTPEEFDVIAGYQLGKMGTPGAAVGGSAELAEIGTQTGAEYVAQQGFSPATFLTNFDKLSKEAKSALFTGGKYQELVPALDDLNFVIKRVNTAAKEQLNPSGTAKAAASVGIFSMFTPAAGALGQAMGGMSFDFGFSALIAPWAGAKLMTNPSYVKWLTKGVEIAAFDPASMGQHIRRLVQIQAANPEIRDQIDATVHGMKEQTIEPIEEHHSPTAKGQITKPITNENAFREVSNREVSDKLMPDAVRPEEMQARMASTQPIQNDMPLFEDLEPAGGLASMGPAMSGFDASMSPTIVPSDSDREIAERMKARSSGIAGLV